MVPGDACVRHARRRRRHGCARVQASGNRASRRRRPRYLAGRCPAGGRSSCVRGDIRNLITAWTLKLPARETCKAEPGDLRGRDPAVKSVYGCEYSAGMHRLPRGCPSELLLSVTICAARFPSCVSVPAAARTSSPDARGRWHVRTLAIDIHTRRRPRWQGGPGLAAMRLTGKTRRGHTWLPR